MGCLSDSGGGDSAWNDDTGGGCGASPTILKMPIVSSCVLLYSTPKLPLQNHLIGAGALQRVLF